MIPRRRIVTVTPDMLARQYRHQPRLPGAPQLKSSLAERVIERQMRRAERQLEHDGNEG